MTHIVAVFLAILVVEMAFKLPIVVVAKKASLQLGKALSVLSSRHISDCWKERALIHYSYAILRDSMVLGLLLAILAAGIFIPVYLLEAGLSLSVITVINSLDGLLLMMLASVGYLYLRKKIVK